MSELAGRGLLPCRSGAEASAGGPSRAGERSDQEAPSELAGRGRRPCRSGGEASAGGPSSGLTGCGLWPCSASGGGEPRSMPPPVPSNCAPDLPESHYLLVRTRLANHRRRAASEAARQCVAIAPGSKLGHSAEVLVLIKSGRWPEAEVACRRALAIDPEDYAARHNLGIAVARQGRTVEGVGHFVAASKLNPTSGSSRRLAVVFGRVHAMRAPMLACAALLLLELTLGDTAAGSTTFPLLLLGLVVFVVVHRRRRLAVLPAGVAELVQLADRRVSRRFGRIAFWTAIAVAASGALIALEQEPRAGIFLVVVGAGLAAVTRRVTAA